MVANDPSVYLYAVHDELVVLRRQYHDCAFFLNDKENLKADLSLIYAGTLAPTLFSWWCVNLPDAVVGGQYQATLETLLSAWHLLEDKNAPQKAKQILLEQASLPSWKEVNYGNELGHDLCSSHHCRGFAAGLEVARSVLNDLELEKLLLNYKKQIREPYLSASFKGNPYLVGVRNTNWLAHISGSVLLCEIALAKFGKEDNSVLALAKANVLRYIDMIRPDGSLPENGDYFHYGVEFAFLSLHAWNIHFGINITCNLSQTGLRNAIQWPLDFTDKDGVFWADFGDTHIGNHEASRVVGYLFARYFQNQVGQWLGDLSKTREPLAALLRFPSIESKYHSFRLKIYSSEQVAVANFENQHLAMAGGACRSPINNIPHRHYDSGSIIYRLKGTNIIADSGFYKYTDTYWTNFDDPAHERSAARYHNVVFVDGRGYQYEDQIAGRLILCREMKPGLIVFAWELTKGYPGLTSWVRQILLIENGLLIVFDCLKLATQSQSACVYWHLHEEAKLKDSQRWHTSLIQGRVISNIEFELQSKTDHPKPYVKIVLKASDNKINSIISIFGDQSELIDSVAFDETNSTIYFENKKWCFNQFL